MNGDPAHQIIEDQRDEGRRLGGTGTPTVIVDGLLHAAPPSLDELRDHVRRTAASPAPRPVSGALLDGQRFDGLPVVDLVPEVVVDGEEAMLVPIRWMLPLDGGGVVVSQDQVPAVRAWNSDGGDRFEAGRRGEGPGEFLALGVAGLKRDTIWVFDPRQRRLTYLDPSGAVAEVQLLPDAVEPSADDPLSPDAWGSIMPLAIGDGTHALAEAFPRGSAHTARGDRHIHLVSFDREWTNGTLVDTLPRQPQVVVRQGGGMGVATVPFTRPPLLAPSPAGDRVAFVDPILAGRGIGTFRVLVLAATGTVVYDHRFPFDPDPIPRAARDSALAESLGRLRGGEVSELSRALAREGQLPEVHPPFTGVLLEPDGRVWLEFARSSTERRYLILDPAGMPEARAAVPPDTRIGAVDGPTVWGVVRGEFGVDSPIRFRRSPPRH